MVRSIFLYLIIALFMMGSFLGLRRLSFATDVLEILPAGIPEVEALQIFREYFDEDHRVILLLRHREEVFEEDAAALTDHLREQIPEVRVQYRSRFEDDREGAARSLARLWADAEPATVSDFASRLEEPERLRQFLRERKEEIAFSLDQGESTKAAFDPLGFLEHPAIGELTGGELDYQSEDGTLWLVIIANPDLGIDYRAHAERVMEIRQAADQWKPDGFDYRLTGGPVFSSEIGAGMEKDMAGTVTITALVVGLLFLLTQRSVIQLGVLAVILGLTFSLTLGLAGWIFGTLNLVSVGFAAILLGLVIDYGVVIARESRPGQQAASIRKEMAPGILWAALTTAVVFGVLMLSTFQGVQQLGALVLIGLAAGALVCLWLMPLALHFHPGKQPKRLLRAPFPGPRVSCCLLGGLLVLAFLLLLIKGPPQVDFDVGMVEPEESEAATALELLQEQFPFWSKKNLSLVARGDSLEDLRSKITSVRDEIAVLKEEGVITRAEWPVALLPNPEARLANSPTWQDVAARSDEVIAALEEAGFSEQGRALDAAVLKNLETIPDELDPFARAFYHPEGYFSGRIQLKDEVSPENVKEVQVLNGEGLTVSGWGVLRLLLLERVKKDLYFLFIPATVVLLGALIVVFRSWRDALLTSGILMTVLTLVNAFAVATDRPWNFLSSMAIPLIVGTGIDYSIHLIFALRRNHGDLNKVWNGVGKGIVFCGLSTMVGFGSLTFASNQTLQSMGLFCSVGVFLTMLLSVITVPPLWRAFHHGWGFRSRTD